MNIIEELYYGNVSPMEEECERSVPFEKLAAANEEKLAAYFAQQPEGQEEERLFSQMVNAYKEILSYREKSRFIEGFRLGARFLLDALVFPENPYMGSLE